MRPTWAEIDLDAFRHNVETVRAVTGTPVMAVVKADAYGHGAVPVARAAMESGAVALAVALVEEGIELREAGLDAPILVLSEVGPSALDAARRAGLTPTLCSVAGVEAAARHPGWAVQIKVDTGMHRMGCPPGEAADLAVRAVKAGLVVAGVWTHCAVADEPDDPFTETQLDAFDAAVAAIEAEGIDPGMRHAANSAAALDRPRARYDVVRAGIALYGVAPSPALAGRAPLRAVMSLRSQVTAVRVVEAGEGVSYGLRWRAPRRTNVATVPIGYADGVPRRLSGRGSVLLHGRRVPIVGTITMDQLLVDAGDLPVAVGDEVVLIGRQGDELLSAELVAEQLGTIGYEVLTSISSRVTRRYTGAR